MFSITHQSRATQEHPPHSIRIYTGNERRNITMLDHERRDQPQHIAQLSQCGELPVVTVAAMADRPDYERTPRHRRMEDNRGECVTVFEGTLANTG